MGGLLKFITCGSVDDGKSTLIGHILYDSKLVYADQEKALELESKVGSRGGAIDYSLLLDGLMAEREQGITIDVAYRYFTTNKKSFIVADTPGHEEYTRNMAVGASFADLAVILTDATQGVLIQTKRHARICALMGIKYFVFAVNKMDLTGYSETRFHEIEEQIKNLAEELDLHNIKIIPVSATEGDNITKLSENIPWYRDKALLPYLEELDISEENMEQGFYMPVQRVCRPDHTFRGFQGQIEAGMVSTGDELTVLPGNETAKVKNIYIGNKLSQEAYKGQPVTIQLSREIDVSRGCVLSADSGIKTAASVTASLLWTDDDILYNNKNFFFKLGTKTIPGIVKEILYTIDVNSGEHKEASSLSKNEIAVCKISLADKIAASEFKKHKTLGEFILIDRISNMTSACGVVESLDTEETGVYEGKIDRNARAALKGQKAVTVVFDSRQRNISRDFAEDVEKVLNLYGRHTYLYAPAQEENILQVVKHLHRAGLIVLLLIDSRHKNFSLENIENPVTEWYSKGTSVDEAAEFIRKQSIYEDTPVQDGNYI